MPTKNQIVQIYKFSMQILVVLGSFFVIFDQVGVASALKSGNMPRFELDSRFLNASHVNVDLSLAIPSDLQVTVLSNTKVRLTWKDNSSDETGFIIADKTLYVAWAPMNATQIIIGNLTPNTTHCYLVSADNGVSNSGWSNEVCVTLSSKTGDANNDGKVDGIDYVIWLNNYERPNPSGPATGDFNNDGKVDGIDYIVWLNNFGK